MSWQGQLISSLVLLNSTWRSFGNNIFINPQVPVRGNSFQADLIACLINIRNQFRSRTTLVISGNFEVDVIRLISDTALNFRFPPASLALPSTNSFNAIISLYLRAFSQYFANNRPITFFDLDWQSFVLRSIAFITFVFFQFPVPPFPTP